MSSSHDHSPAPAYVRIVMLLAPWRSPSPGSTRSFQTSQTIRPRSSSTTCHSIGKRGISLPGNVVIVSTIQRRISSRPLKSPYACSLYVASSAKRSAKRVQSPEPAIRSTSSW